MPEGALYYLYHLETVSPWPSCHADNGHNSRLMLRLDEKCLGVYFSSSSQASTAFATLHRR